MGVLLLYNLFVFAANGLNAIGFGVNSMGLAGTDVAVIDDTYALSIYRLDWMKSSSNAWVSMSPPFFLWI